MLLPKNAKKLMKNKIYNPKKGFGYWIKYLIGKYYKRQQNYIKKYLLIYITYNYNT